MKAIILVHHDGSRLLAFVTSVDFDTQAWANDRRDVFALLQVVRVVEDVATEL
jgi:hypothetical protein